MENTAKKIFMVLFCTIILLSVADYVKAGNLETWCNNGATCTESNNERNSIKINCYTSVHSWSSTYTASGCSKTNSCSAYSGGTNQGHVRIIPENTLCEGDPCPFIQKTGTLTVACKGDGGAPPPPPPPAPRCGDGSCQWTWTYKEGCKAGTHTDGSTINDCNDDCRGCRNEVYPNEATWCQNNCIADNSCRTYHPRDCGAGWGYPSNGFTYSKYCCKNPPAGVTCGTCATAAVCGDSSIGTGETCDDGNTVTETCTYGQTSCTICNSACKSIAGTTSYCGDGKYDSSNEGCDDGNTANSDGCSKTCTIETGYTCTGSPSVCFPGETCFDGIDNNGNGNIDEGCEGCADLNTDGKVDFQDLFILADCAGSSSPSGGCPVKAFYNADFNDDKFIDAEAITRSCLLGRECGDLNGDKKTDLNDFFIFADCTGGKTTGACTPTIFDKVDLDRNSKIDKNEIDYMLGRTAMIGSDGLCWLQNWWKSDCGTNCNSGCKTCTLRTIGQTCASDYECVDSQCSKGKEGNLPTGHCCAEGAWWDDNNKGCSGSALSTCTCNIDPLKEPGKYLRECIAGGFGCRLSNIYSKGTQQYYLDIKKK
ncbi:MAG: hypothetical protein KKG75_00340 [Nanoarchaeota archaeon]|nr:hypothetical protein [Nanoarchaeota archaeon]